MRKAVIKVRKERPMRHCVWLVVASLAIFSMRAQQSLAGPATPLVAPQADPQKEDAEKAKLIEEILALSGARKQLEQIPRQIDLGFKQSSKQNPEVSQEVVQAVEKAIPLSFRPEALYQSAVNSMRKNFDQERAWDVLSFLRSPLSKKFTQLEVEASTPEEFQKMQEFAQQLPSHPPAPGRLALVQRLAQAGGSIELNLDVLVLTARATMKALNPYVPAGRRLTEEQLEKQLSSLRDQLRESTKNFILVQMLYTYRSVSGQEMAKYVEFQETDAGQWFVKVVRESMLDGMSAATQELGKRLAEAKLK